MIFTLDSANWAGKTPATIYAFTNAWFYLVVLVVIGLIVKAIKYLVNSAPSQSLSDINVDFSDLKSVRECIGHPIVVLTLAVMTLHRFIFYAPMNPLFEGLLDRGWGLF